MPNIDSATARVLDALGVQPIMERRSGCCGAIRHHLNDHGGALDDVRRNIDAWWPHLEAGGVEAIVINASGCGAMLKDYAHLLRDDPAYAEKARRVTALVQDLAEYLPSHAARLQAMLAAPADANVDASAKPAATGAARPDVVFHPPCTLQHGQQVKGAVESLLGSLGVNLLPFAESHLCCGSAGTYSVTQPALSRSLRDRKLANLQARAPQLILSANIGCLTHLQSGTATPVRHWIEWLDEALREAAVGAAVGAAVEASPA
jgi:glycolate oxidase iron-sulfur subunit